MVWLVLKMSGWKANLLATIVIVIDILVLAYFKYFGFFVQEIIGLFVSLPPNWKELSPIPVPSQIPPGVSFYTFQMVAFVVDSLREKKKKPLAVLDYVNFISFFPLSQVRSSVAGIYYHKWRDFASNLQEKTSRRVCVGFPSVYL